MADAIDAPALTALLDASRARTLRFAAGLAAGQWMGPYLKIVNPPLWEIGHLAWFQEHWCLRHAPGGALAASVLDGADVLYDSAKVAHATRWSLRLPTVDTTLAYLARVLDNVKSRLAREGATPHLAYFVRLAVFHEDMHNEAFDYTLQTHGWVAKDAAPDSAYVIESVEQRVSGDAAISGGRFRLGAEAEQGFAFDNEKWAHEVEVQPFQMSRTAVSNGEFAEFVQDGGYGRREWWCEAGWQWLSAHEVSLPNYWKIEQNQILRRYHQTWEPLPQDAAMIHVNGYEADAYCRWARRRLPTEAEWEFAASTAPDNMVKRRYPWGDELPTHVHANLAGVSGKPVSVHAHAAGDSAWGVRQLFGNVWEWTASTFEAYPGFVRDPYKEYSEPWFGTHKVLRGGCYATEARLLRNTWRNFYTPERRDVLAGFRTCAL